MIMGIDAGNDNVKIATENGVFSFNSCIGEFRERKLVTRYQDEMIVEYNGQKYFMGDLAEKESHFPRRSLGTTKANPDVKLRVLVAVHRFGSERNKIVVGQPIKSHIPAEKEKIINMLAGKHTVTLNGISKTFYIDEVKVAGEGASAWFGWFYETPNFRIIDFGSGTVNISRVQEWGFIDRDSETLNFGTRTTEEGSIDHIINGVIAKTFSTFNPDDYVLLVGGVAGEVYPLIKVHYPNTILAQPVLFAGRIEEPKFANAIGFYNLGKEVFKNG